MKKIIHVDHSAFFRKFLRSFLQREGFDVESYDNTRDSTFAIGVGSIDMVIIGLTFVDAEGEEFLERIQQTYAGPVIVLSSSVDKAEVEEKLLTLGITDAISKTGPWQQRLKQHLLEL